MKIFYAAPGTKAVRQAGSLLLRSLNWNDWFEFRTLFELVYVDERGVEVNIGSVKIGDLEHEYKNVDGAETPLPPAFDELPPRFISIGQGDSYYERLLEVLGGSQMRAVLRALGDLAINPSRFEELRGIPLVRKSLFRDLNVAVVRGSFARLAQGDLVESANFHLKFQAKPSDPWHSSTAPLLDFEVDPESMPPTNVHALIGRNGSGKTTLLKAMARSIIGKPFVRPGDGSFELADAGSGLSIASLVYVSFSAFDEVDVPVLDNSVAYDRPYSYIGLQYLSEDEGDNSWSWEPETPDPRTPEKPDAKKVTRAAGELGGEFARSAWVVRQQPSSLELWQVALELLESDQNFKSAEVADLARPSLEGEDEETYKNRAENLFRRNLSSGHKIVLLAMTRLVQTVTERTLVLIDEPEGHLHPPLLSAWMRALSYLMKERNGLAVVATHSPVVLQEVPRRSVYVINREGDEQSADRVDIETFAENVGVLTHSVFGLEVTSSGFYTLLVDAAKELGVYAEVLQRFDSQVGFEGRALLKSILPGRIEPRIPFRQRRSHNDRAEG
ncbi:AAA family ATPase [uncultured Amnibacterium sp.]|uniref:AAA family ATPase n=1 Tax=uncultured Amnibacterium sp. TaxID=1631851 RepID=UPI0035CA5910